MHSLAPQCDGWEFSAHHLSRDGVLVQVCIQWPQKPKVSSTWPIAEHEQVALEVALEMAQDLPAGCLPCCNGRLGHAELSHLALDANLA
jgi:hypothetical protein